MEAITINVSVRELVAFSIPTEESRGFSMHTAREGVEGHQAMHAQLKEQLETSGTYQKEVPVSMSFTHENYSLQLAGRLDGLIEINNSISLCEIKTTEKSLNQIDKAENPAYWAQGRCYAYMVARDRKLDKINLLLIYYHRTQKESRTFEETLTITELEKFFHGLVFPYINGLKKQHEWQNTRNQSIHSLQFPYTEFRKGQRHMSAAVYRAIRDGNKQFIQAPTGIGKTMGALFPALKAMGEGLIDKVFYLTARNTTQAIAIQAYEMMVEKELRLKTLHITAKEKVCFCPETPCTEDDCIYLSDYSNRSRKVLSQLFKETDFFSREFVTDAAKKHTLCPFELSLDLSLQSDLILCDYNYAFDPRVFLKRFFQDKTDEKLCLMVDEAHNLPDRAREMFSAQIQRSQISQVYRQIKDTLPQLAGVLKQVRQAFLEYIRQLPRQDEAELPWFWGAAEPPEDLIRPIENFMYHCEDFLNDETAYPFKEDLITLYFELAHFAKIYDLFGENYITFLSREKGDFLVRLFCIDPAPMLKKRMDSAKSTILFSATLSPPQYFKEVLGGGEKDGYMILPSPFPRDNLFLYVDDTISTRYRNREEGIPSLVNIVHDCVSARIGNYIVFFPSFSYMQKVSREYQKQYPGEELLVQEMNMKEQQRADFLDRFSSYGETTLVAFAVMGGIFGEGIDLKGELLSGAIVVGVGLPQVCAERDMIRQYYQQKTGNGFDFAYTYPGLNKVQQAAGRVIRSESDRGFVILVDDRFTTSSYKKILPPEWFPLKTPKGLQSLSAGLKDFWSKGSGAF
ncbi:MAG: ATP-dependent DNA helicase [Thermoclostridium sp.]|nr:ATP-dependent DNA helicase [Thermoclostridium sp.]